MLCYEAVSGLKVNFHERIDGCGSGTKKTSVFAGIMGCKVGALPISYLGLPLCVGQVKKSLWNPVVES